MIKTVSLETAKESWKDIPGYEEYYQVSNFGRVRSLDRIIVCYGDKIPYYHKKCRGRILKPNLGSRGYYSVDLHIGVGERVSVHRLVYETFFGKTSMLIDHIDGNKLNNNLSNLRECNSSQNVSNSSIVKAQSGYKGVRLNKRGKYESYIKHLGRTKHLGTFTSAYNAAVAYNNAATKLFGEFAYQNKLPKLHDENIINLKELNEK